MANVYTCIWFIYRELRLNDDGGGCIMVKITLRVFGPIETLNPNTTIMK